MPYLQDPYYSALSTQIRSAVDDYNIPVITAAGNNSDNAAWYMPGNCSRVINVGGLAKSSDTKWSFSNYGFNIEFYAASQFVEAASTRLAVLGFAQDTWRSGLPDCASYPADTCTSGTSFAAPHVAGVIARYKESNQYIGRDAIVAALRATVVSRGGPWVYETQTGAYVPILVYRD